MIEAGIIAYKRPECCVYYRNDFVTAESQALQNTILNCDPPWKVLIFLKALKLRFKVPVEVRIAVPVSQRHRPSCSLFSLTSHFDDFQQGNAEEGGSH